MRQVPHAVKNLLTALCVWISQALLISLIGLTNAAATTKPTCPSFLYSDPRSYIDNTQGIPIIHLYGNSKQMGLAYGKLMKPQLRAFYASIQQAIDQRHINQQSIQTAQLLYNHYPTQWQHFLTYLAKGSNLPLHAIIIVNSFEHLAIFSPITDKNSTEKIGSKKSIQQTTYQSPVAKNNGLSFGCDELFIHTAKQNPILLRWYDYFSGHQQWRNKLVITVFHSDNKNKNSVALITYLGTLNATTLINDKGLFLAVNNGKYSAWRMAKKNQQVDYSFIFSTTSLLDNFFDAKSMADLRKDMTTHKTSLALLYLFYDSQQNILASYETTPTQGTFFYPANKHYFSMTNHFQRALFWQPYFLRPAFADNISSLTYSRIKHLNQLAVKLIDKNTALSNTQIKNLLSRPYRQGGVERASTVAEMSFDFKQKKILIRTPPSGLRQLI